MHPNLRAAGVLPSLDMPHHLRANEECEFREGIAIETTPDGCVVDTGLPDKFTVPNTDIPQNARVTVRLPRGHSTGNAELVHSSTPRTEMGYYWGYYVRRCHSLSDVFTECPFDGGYDLSFGTSERGVPVSGIVDAGRPDYRHLLVVFGGVAGIEAAVKNDPELKTVGVTPAEAEKLFDHWVNLVPGQGSRTIRTEEAVWIGLMGLRALGG